MSLYALLHISNIDKRPIGFEIKRIIVLLDLKSLFWPANVSNNLCNSFFCLN